MAESKVVLIIPLNGSNYPTWKIQCQMVLMRDGLWSIVNGSETAPADNTTDRYSRFVTRRDRPLAMIVLSITIVYDRYSRGSGSSLAVAVKSVYEKDVGQPTSTKT